jgi:hypothetical protein
MMAVAPTATIQGSRMSVSLTQSLLSLGLHLRRRVHYRASNIGKLRVDVPNLKTGLMFLLSFRKGISTCLSSAPEMHQAHQLSAVVIGWLVPSILYSSPQ